MLQHSPGDQNFEKSGIFRQAAFVRHTIAIGMRLQQMKLTSLAARRVSTGPTALASTAGRSATATAARCTMLAPAQDSIKRSRAKDGCSFKGRVERKSEQQRILMRTATNDHEADRTDVGDGQQYASEKTIQAFLRIEA